MGSPRPSTEEVPNGEASSGIGRATAIRLADAGYRAFAGDLPREGPDDFDGREEAGSEPSVVAEAVERALSAERPKRRYPVGADAQLMLGVSRIPEPLRDQVVYRVFGLGADDE